MYDFGIRNALSGYRPAHRAGDYCPGCGKGNWYVGRVSAECANCGTAIPLAPIEAQPAAPISDPSWASRV